MSSVEKNRVSIEEWLVYDDGHPYKSEYHRGEIIDMSGGTYDHGLIAMNLGTAINNALKRDDCVTIGSDLKLWIAKEEACYYPDLMVICGGPEFSEIRNDMVMNPILVAEVLSKSSAAFDRGRKFLRYQSVPSLREYVILEQDSAHVDVFFRPMKGAWTFSSAADLDQSIRLQSLGIELPLREIYRNASWM